MSPVPRGQMSAIGRERTICFGPLEAKSGRSFRCRSYVCFRPIADIRVAGQSAPMTEQVGKLVMCGFILTTLASCGPKPCDLERMREIIHKEIRDDQRSPDEYVMEQPRRDGDLIYVGMAEKINLLYRRHYLIDPKRCEIKDLLIDQ